MAKANRTASKLPTEAHFFTARKDTVIINDLPSELQSLVWNPQDSHCTRLNPSAREHPTAKLGENQAPMTMPADRAHWFCGSCTHSCHSISERYRPSSSPKPDPDVGLVIACLFLFLSFINEHYRGNCWKRGGWGIVCLAVCFYSIKAGFLLPTKNCLHCISLHHHCSVHELSGLYPTFIYKIYPIPFPLIFV